MKITKVKKTSRGKYKLLLDNKEQISLYEDVIINKILLPNKSIDNNDMKEIIKDNYYAEVYNKALNYISIRLRSKKELENYLIKREYDEKVVNNIISRLIEEGYIDDNRFANSYVNDKLNLSNYGPYRILRDLQEYGVKESIINETISNLDNNLIKDKIIKLIDKKIKVSHNVTGNVLKNKILNYLISLGYERDMIISCLNNIKFDNRNNLIKEYDKLYKKYKSKYNEYELKMIIKQKLYQKGYTDIDIDNLLK
jgi:regulatory protein